jgi:hypothetical protein
VGDSVAIAASGRGVSTCADHKYECQSLFPRSFYCKNGDKTGTVTSSLAMITVYCKSSSVAMISVYCRSRLTSNKCVAYQILHLQNSKPESLK